MNKKFLSAILFGALMVTSTGTFVSCKDYDDDIDAINKELTDVKSQIAALQAKVDAGKWITSVSSNATGVTINLSDGSSVNITNGKDGQNGAQGEAGKDGKDGSVVEVKDGVLYINGEATEIKVAEEAPAALPCVKVENGELMILGENNEYVASGIKACSVVAVKENGVWTITTADGESIVVPGSAALASIAIQGDKDLIFNYGKVAKDAAWGWTADGGVTYDETMEAGFYTRLNQDVDVLLNPAEADGTAFTYTFKNSKGEAADVTFFGEARPSTSVLTLSRAASANGLWTLPAAVSKFEATSINELRNELYLKFKQNDGNPYAMTLEATDLLGSTAVRSDYDYTITLKQATGGAKIYDMKNCEIAQVYYPSIVGPVYDYKIRVTKTAANLRLAKAFGIEVTADEKGFSAANDAAVLNAVSFDYAYVTIAGAKGSGTFTASFTDGLTASENLRADELNAPFNAVLANTLTKAGDVHYAPTSIDEYLEEYKSYGATDGYRSKEKVFVLKHKYDLTAQYAALSEDAKMLFDESINAATAELIGGEAGNLEDNYNAANRNGQLLKNITWSYNSSKKQIEVSFYVSDNWKQPTTGELSLADGEVTDAEWDAYANFQLKTAYQLNLSVPDAVTGEEIALIELPFEFTQPDMDVVGVDRNYEGAFSKWGTHDVWNAAGTVYHHCDVLYMFGAYDATKFYMPLYDAFNIWNQSPYNKKNINQNAEYYTLTTDIVNNFRLEGAEAVAGYGVTALSKITYGGDWEDYGSHITIAHDLIQDAIAAQTDPDALEQDKEAWVYVNVDYKFYNVYPATKEQLGYFGESNTAYNPGFRMVFASTIQKSTFEMTEDVLYANAKKNDVFVSNDNVVATTMLGDEFVLFPGLYGNTDMTRAELNYERGFNEEQRPFVEVTAYEISAKYVHNEKVITSVDTTPQVGTWDADVANGKYVIGAVDPSLKDVQVWAMPSMPAKAKDTTYPVGMKAQTGGLVIVLGNNIDDRQPVEVTIRVKDDMGFFNDLKVIVQKLK